MESQDKKTYIKGIILTGVFGIAVACITVGFPYFTGDKSKAAINDSMCNTKKGELNAYVSLIQQQMLKENEERKQLNLIYWRDKFTALTKYDCEKLIEKDVEINQSISLFKSFFFNE